MCGRYASSRKPEDLIEEFEVTSSRVAVPLTPDYNVAPTKEVYAVLERPPREDRSAPAQRQLRTLRWGLVPSWAKDPAIGSRMINARMETLADKPSFRRAFSSRRCLLPADGYFEWYPISPSDERASPEGSVETGSREPGKPGKPRKQPFFIRPKDGGVLAMAGLYEIWKDPTRVPDDPDDPDLFRWTCTVITTDAPDDLGRIHDRMPLMVPPEQWSRWLDPTVSSASGRDELLALLEPAAPGLLEAYPVSTEVNNVRNNGPDLVAPLPVGG